MFRGVSKARDVRVPSAVKVATEDNHVVLKVTNVIADLADFGNSFKTNLGFVGEIRIDQQDFGFMLRNFD